MAVGVACQKVPLLAPTGSTIVLTATTTAISANGTTPIVAQVLENAGTPPHEGTQVTFTTTLGSLDPQEALTDANGQVTTMFLAVARTERPPSARSPVARRPEAPVR